MDAVKDFITKEEHSELLAWAYSVKNLLLPNLVTPNRFFRRLNELPENKIVQAISTRVLDTYNLSDVPKTIGDLGGFLGWHNEGGAVHEHTDYLEKGRHYRFNLFLSLPESGGIPIYNGEILDVEERMLIPYEADIYKHSSTVVVGGRPRIIISFGWIFDDVGG